MIESRTTVQQGRPSESSSLGPESGIEILRRFVQDQDLRVGEKGAGQGEPSGLAATEPGAPLTDAGGDAIRQVGDELLRPRRRSAAATSSSEASGRASRRFASMVSAKR